MSKEHLFDTDKVEKEKLKGKALITYQGIRHVEIILELLKLMGDNASVSLLADNYFHASAEINAKGLF